MSRKRAILAVAALTAISLAAGPATGKPSVSMRCFDHVHNGYTCLHFVDGALVAFTNDYGTFYVD